MLKLRFKRLGRAHSPFYRLVVMEARSKRNGKTLEDLGHYDPFKKIFSINKDKVQHWLSVGAQPTVTVGRLLAKEKLVKAETVATKKYSDKPGRKSVERAEKKKEKAATPAE